jgi:hypothetical protein
MLKISLSNLLRGKALCGLTSLVVACFAAASASPTNGPTEAGIANASQALARYASSRRELVQAWATIIKAIEQSYDPSFNPKQRFSCPIPPPPASGQLQPCSDPASISDPTARAQYETALANFKLQLAKARRYQQLVNIEGGAFSGLNMSLKLMSEVAPDGTSPDFAALDSILQQTGLATATRAKIDAMFYAGPGP